MKKFTFFLLLLGFYCFADDAILDSQYKKEIENAKNLQNIFNFDTWSNVNFKKKDSNSTKSFHDFSDLEKHVYVLIVAENSSRMLASLEKSWIEKKKTNENYANLDEHILNLHNNRKIFYSKYLEYVENLNEKFKSELTNEEMNLIIKQIKEFSKKEKLD